MVAIREMYARPIKSLGQNFLTNKDIAIAEAAHSYDKVVLEMGPGYGILTKELVKHAKKVIAIEKDANLARFLKSEIKSKNFTIINKDFFKAAPDEFGKEKIDIMIANIPYNLSSKTVEWLFDHSMQAVLCLQKEFVEHMRAKCNTDKYSRLSVMSELCFSMTKIIDVSRGNFYPIPRVDSAIIYLKPKKVSLSPREKQMISFMMQHKNKSIRNSLMDSHRYLKMEKSEISEAIKGIDERVNQRAYKLEPSQILEVAVKAAAALENK